MERSGGVLPASDQTETDTFGRVVHLPRRQSSGSIARCQSFTSMQKGRRAGRCPGRSVRHSETPSPPLSAGPRCGALRPEQPCSPSRFARPLPVLRASLTTLVTDFRHVNPIHGHGPSALGTGFAGFVRCELVRRALFVGGLTAFGCDGLLRLVVRSPRTRASSSWLPPSSFPLFIGAYPCHGSPTRQGRCTPFGPRRITWWQLASAPQRPSGRSSLFSQPPSSPSSWPNGAPRRRTCRRLILPASTVRTG